MSDNTKVCSKCGLGKDRSEYHKSKSKPDGLQSRCKDCNNTGVREWQGENPDRFEINWKKQYGNPRRRATKYGLTLEEMEQMLEKANGLCTICSEPPIRWLVIDHCHTTGSVRGILCEKCNQALGLMRDNVEYLSKAIDYLNESRNLPL